jgi:integrase/recombinase XerC
VLTDQITKMFHTNQFIANISFERRLSGHTVIAYRNDMEQFVAFIESDLSISRIEQVSHKEIRQWVVSLLEAENTAKTVNRKLSCLKTYFKYLMKNDLITINPMLKVVSPKLPKRLPSVVQEKQIDQLLRLVDFGEGLKGLRNRLIIELMYGTGIRKQELIQLKLSDFMYQRGLIKVFGKGGKERLVPIPKYLSSLIDQYLGVRNEKFAEGANQSFFVTDQGKELYPKLVYQVVHQYLSMVSSAQQRSPHTLRHSFATHLSDHGADLNAIKTLLGHSSLASTQVYMHNSLSRLKAVYDQAHPKSKNEDQDA